MTQEPRNDNINNNKKAQEAKEDIVRKLILHVLEIYPRLSSSLLQQAIGPQYPSSVWRPIVQTMLDAGEIVLHNMTAERPTGMMKTYTVYMLPNIEVHTGK